MTHSQLSEAGRQELICSYPVTLRSVGQCTDRIMTWIDSGSIAKYLICANPHSLVEAEKDPEFKRAILHADLVLPDGIGIVVASKMLRGRIRERITGSDIFRSVSRRLSDQGYGRVFFLGSTKSNLAEIKQKMAMDYPGISAVGSYSPPFKPRFSDIDNADMIDAVNRFRPDVLWVGMTAPKQEKWIYGNRDRLNVRFSGAIGAVFDFYIGRVKRSHPVFQKTGLEWLPRLLRQPRRLWRRTLLSAPRFLSMVVRTRIN